MKHTRGKAVVFIVAAMTVGGCASTSSSLQAQAESHLIDGVTGAPLTLESIQPLLAASRHIYVGEEHASAEDHAVQLAVLETLQSMGQGIVLGVEWLPYTLQGELSQWQAEPLSKDNFLKLVDWQKTWGFDLELYWPILSWAHTNRVPIIALNAPRKLVFGFSEHGREGLTPEDRQALPPLDSGNAAHRAYFVHMMRKAAEEMGTKGHHTGFEEHIDSYYQAQLIWDETMARQVSKLFKAPEHQLHTIVVLAGRGHVDFGLGIPERVLKATQHDYLTIAPATEKHPPTTEEEEQMAGWPVARAHIFWLAP